MKISDFLQVSKLIPTSQTNTKTNAEKNANKEINDTVSFHVQSSELENFVKLAKEKMQAESTKTQDVLSQLTAGTYQVSGKDVVLKIMGASKDERNHPTI